MLNEIRVDNSEVFEGSAHEVIDRFKMLALALRTSRRDEASAWEIMRGASILFHGMGDTTFNDLYDAVAMEIVRVNAKNEFHIQELFKRNVQKVLGEQTNLINKKNNPKHKPDLWIKLNDEEVPVEVKLHNFNKKALEQLTRYMEFYQCASGVAVGRLLTVEIPDTITFISIESLEE